MPLPVSAWNNQSFVGNDYFSGSSDLPVSSLYSASTYSSSSNGIYSGSDLAALFSLSPSSQYCGVELLEFSEGSSGAVEIPDYSWYTIRPDQPLTTNFSIDGTSVSVSMPLTSISTKFDEVRRFQGIFTSSDASDFGSHSLINSVGYSNVYIDFDTSSLASDVTDIEFVGSLSVSCLYQQSLFQQSVDGGSLVLYVNGAPTDVVFSADGGVIQFNNYLYSSDVPITDVSFRVDIPSFKRDYTFNTVSIAWTVSLDFSNSQFSFIAGSSGGVVDTDKVQGEITEHEDIESQWGGSMTENFDALDIENFSYPDGLASAFALISGIFQDFWYGMGEYGILYVFPLTLAIMLLVIGRLSKFAGRSKSEKGGDD